MKYERMLINTWAARIKSGRNLIVLFVGPTGEGKSWSAVRLAELLLEALEMPPVPTFIFKTRFFLAAVRENVPRRVLLWDEAGLGMPAREWQSLFNKIAGYISQSFRFKNLVLFITVPDMSFIDIQQRKLAHWIVFCREADREAHKVRASPYRIVTDPISGNMYTPYPMFQGPHYSFQLRELKIDQPTPEGAARYEAERLKFIEAYYDVLAQEIEEMAR